MSEVISEGMLVYVMIDRKRKYLVKVEKGGILGTDKGYIKHDDIIGKKYGEAISTSQGYTAYLLKPLPHDYLEGFIRATQVIYPKDASLMIYLSGIQPGSIVIEAGIGSGFLTSYIARIVGDQGHVYAYEIRKEFIEVARKNLEKIGLLHRVTIKHRDIRMGIDEENVDAIFLDMPDPWNVLEHAHKALKPSRPILIYLPTANQLIKIIKALQETKGFIDINVYETILRDYIIDPEALRPRTLMVGHTGYIVFARKIEK